MKKFDVITAESSYGLKSEIEKWNKENPLADIVKIKPITRGSGHNTIIVFIIYNETVSFNS